MTNFMETLLRSMSSTFNSDCATGTEEGGSLLNLHFAEDKTVKWRNLMNNQFACKDKQRQVLKTTTLPTTSAVETTNSTIGVLQKGERILLESEKTVELNIKALLDDETEEFLTSTPNKHQFQDQISPEIVRNSSLNVLFNVNRETIKSLGGTEASNKLLITTKSDHKEKSKTATSAIETCRKHSSSMNGSSETVEPSLNVNEQITKCNKKNKTNNNQNNKNNKICYNSSDTDIEFNNENLTEKLKKRPVHQDTLVYNKRTDTKIKNSQISQTLVQVEIMRNTDKLTHTSNDEVVSDIASFSKEVNF